MGTNYYMRLKEPVRTMVRIGDIVPDEIELANPDQVVEVIDRRAVHIAKTSWGWTPSFQATPSLLPFSEQVRANDHYEIASLADIRAYLATGEYEIVDEDGDVISRKDFEKTVVGWEKVMRDGGYQGEIKSHDGQERDALCAYRDPLGYQFCRTCFC